jgi:hypothetical protein
MNNLHDNTLLTLGTLGTLLTWLTVGRLTVFIGFFFPKQNVVRKFCHFSIQMLTGYGYRISWEHYPVPGSLDKKRRNKMPLHIKGIVSRDGGLVEVRPWSGRLALN